MLSQYINDNLKSEAVFWKVIDNSRADINVKSKNGNFNIQLGTLERELTQLTKSEFILFNQTYRQLFFGANKWELWEAAYIIGGGCSDDCFMDFRNWVISMGKDTYDLSMNAPDELVKYASDKSVEDFFFEEFGYVAQDVYKKRFGENFPPIGKEFSPVPCGKKWDENDYDGSRRRFPKLTKQFEY